MGSWCAPCVEEVDDLVEARERLPRNDVVFLGTHIKDNRAAAQTFEQGDGVTWPSVYNDDGSLLLGFRDSLVATAVPTTYVIDADGRVAARMLDKQAAESSWMWLAMSWMAPVHESCCDTTAGGFPSSCCPPTVSPLLPADSSCLRVPR